MNQNTSPKSPVLKWIIVVSVAIPLVVAILLFVPYNLSLSGYSWVRSLPAVNAILNSTTAVLLVLAVMAVKAKKVKLHQRLMLTSLILGALFLISYVIYHASTTSTKYGDSNHDGVVSATELTEVPIDRGVYLFTLLSHIGLSIVVVPFVLLAFYFALSGQIDKHKKIVKFTFPIWLYVSITGVLVYLMISPYYL